MISAQPGRDAAALPADAGRDRRQQNSTIVFPVPIDLLKPLLQASQYDGTENRPPPRPVPPADTSERTLEAADGAREIAGGASGHESRAELDAEVDAEIEKQVELVKEEVERVQEDLARRKP